MSSVPRPKKSIASVEAYRRSHLNDMETWKSLYNDVVELIGPDCPHEPFREGAPLLNNGVGSSGRDVGVQVSDPNDDLIEVVRGAGGSGNATINLASSSDEDIDTKQNVILQSLMMKTVISNLKQEKSEDHKSLLHYIVMENLPSKIADHDLERDVFDLVGVDRKALALNIQRNKTDSVVQIYTNDLQQVQKILACDRKVVVGGRVLATRIGTAGRI